MSDNVIHYDFKSKLFPPDPNEHKSSTMIDDVELRNDYLKMCKEELHFEEYKDVLCAIMDRGLYNKLDPDLKMIVDVYLTLDG